jgi:hypothetical protein
MNGPILTPARRRIRLVQAVVELPAIIVFAPRQHGVGTPVRELARVCEVG